MFVGGLNFDDLCQQGFRLFRHSFCEALPGAFEPIGDALQPVQLLLHLAPELLRRLEAGVNLQRGLGGGLRLVQLAFLEQQASFIHFRLGFRPERHAAELNVHELQQGAGGHVLRIDLESLSQKVARP